MKTEFTYSEALRGVYLGHCDGSLELLRSTPDEILRLFGTHHFCAMLIIAGVAGLESYLRDRLGRTLFLAGTNEMASYIYEFNHSHKEDYRLKFTVKEGDVLSDEQKRLIGESLNRINYHQVRDLSRFYFRKLFKVNIRFGKYPEKIDEIIKLRNILAHSGRISTYMTVVKKLEIADAARVLDTISDYITAVEARFLNKGYEPVLDESERYALGLEDVSISIPIKKPGA
jgi:hypothetical protein